jgi:hypothetical protein
VGGSHRLVSDRLGGVHLDTYCHAVKGWLDEAAATAANLMLGGQP